MNAPVSATRRIIIGTLSLFVIAAGSVATFRSGGAPSWLGVLMMLAGLGIIGVVVFPTRSSRK